MLLIRSYQLLVSGYSGTAGDAMGYNSGHKFSTQDRDNDNKGGSCATERKGPWWFSNCSFSQLIKIASTTAVNRDLGGVTWYTIGRTPGIL